MTRKSKLGKPKGYWTKTARKMHDKKKYSKLDNESYNKAEWWEYAYRKAKRKAKKLW